MDINEHLQVGIDIGGSKMLLLALQWRGDLDAAIDSNQKYALPDLWAACQLQVSPHGSDLVALGAARNYE